MLVMVTEETKDIFGVLRLCCPSELIEVIGCTCVPRAGSRASLKYWLLAIKI